MPENVTIRRSHLTDTPEGFIVELIIADSNDLETASTVLTAKVPVTCEKWWRLAAIQREVLGRLRDVVGDEILRTRRILDRQPD